MEESPGSRRQGVQRKLEIVTEQSVASQLEQQRRVRFLPKREIWVKRAILPAATSEKVVIRMSSRDLRYEGIDR